LKRETGVFHELLERSRPVRVRFGLASSRFFVPDIRSWWLRLPIALGLALATAVVYRLSAAWAGTGSYFMLAFIAVIASAWLARFAAGVITLVSCAVLALTVYAEPGIRFAIAPQDARLLLLYLLGGALICLIVEALHFGHDVTATLRSRSETLGEELAGERERLRALLGNLPGLVWEAWSPARSARPSMTFVSSTLETRLNWSPNHFASPEDVWQRVLHPDDEERLWAALRAARAGSVGSLRSRWLAADGQVRWFDTYFSTLSATWPATGVVRCVSLDVTDAERAERAVEESERRFRAAADRAPMMMSRADVHGNSMWANRAWLEFRGRPLEFELGLGWLRDVHPDDLDEVARALTRTAGQSEELRLEFRVRRFDGTYPWVLWVRVPELGPDGDLVGYLGFRLDISERKELEFERERLLAQTESARAQAELATRSKDEFLAKVSHELRNPLNGILGWVQLLRRGDVSEDENERGLGMIESGARALAQLVDDLLDVSRIIAGKMELVREPTDLRQVLEASCNTVTPAAEAKGVLLDCACEEDLPPVLGDARRLQQVVWNLLANGVKFTPRGGKVTARVTREGSDLVLVVTDTGIGIAPEFLPDVFSPFRQGESTTTRRYQGLGLGLAIVRQLTELHGGRAYAASAGTNQGASFTVRLPVAPIDRLAAVAPPAMLDGARSGQLAGVDVLVVDDDPTARELLHLLLTRAGAASREASSPSEAMELFQERAPDVLLSDIEMPDEDGYSLLRRVRLLRPEAGGSLPAIALTAFALSEDRARTAQAGFQAHLAKPVDADTLVGCIARLAGGDRATVTH
jgi:PAS domain S-box-containing protein